MTNSTAWSVIQMLGAVTDISFGLLSIRPKFADGTPIENIEDAIIHSDGQEIKAWAAIAAYLESFADTDGDGISDIPASYSEFQERKVVEDSTKLLDLIRNPNKYAVMIVLAVIIVLTILVLLLVLIIKLIRKVYRKIHS